MYGCSVKSPIGNCGRVKFANGTLEKHEARLTLH